MASPTDCTAKVTNDIIVMAGIAVALMVPLEAALLLIFLKMSSRISRHERLHSQWV